jgi:ribosomal protein L11 methyltransferase
LIVTVTVLAVPAVEAELGADRLMQAGAFAVEERLGDRGLVELRAVLADSESAAGNRIGDVPAGWSVYNETFDDTHAETWRDHARPVVVTPDLVLRPAWLPGDGAADVTEVAIEPGATFGLGDHPTTRLCAAAIWRTRPAPRRVLDVGAGSGVLAIVALLAGAHTATAIDIADVSPAAVADNARRNGVADRIRASTTPLEHIADEFDLVVANILAPELVGLAPHLVRVTAPGGLMLLSGMLDGRYAHVVAALAPLELTRVDTLEGWVALTLDRPVSDPGPSE